MSAHTRLLKNTAILNIAASGWFSSDRTIAEHEKEIWNTDHEFRQKTGFRLMVMQNGNPGTPR